MKDIKTKIPVLDAFLNKGELGAVSIEITNQSVEKMVIGLVLSGVLILLAWAVLRKL